VVLTNETVSDFSDVSARKQLVNDPTSLRLQKVHDIFDRWTVCCNHVHYAITYTRGLLKTRFTGLSLVPRNSVLVLVPSCLGLCLGLRTLVSRQGLGFGTLVSRFMSWSWYPCVPSRSWFWYPCVSVYVLVLVPLCPVKVLVLVPSCLGLCLGLGTLVSRFMSWFWYPCVSVYVLVFVPLCPVLVLVW